MRTPILLLLATVTAAALVAAGPAAAAITGPTPVHAAGVVEDSSATTALSSDGHRYVVSRGAGNVEHVWDERSGRTASVRTACHLPAATGRHGQFLLACGAGRYEVLDAPALRVHRLPLVRGEVEAIRVGRHWVEVMLFAPTDDDDSSASEDMVRLIDWRRSRTGAATIEACHDLDTVAPRVDTSDTCWPLRDQLVEDGWLLEHNYSSIMEDYEHLTLTAPDHRRGVLDRNCVWQRCRPALGGGWATWQRARTGGGVTVHAYALASRRRFTWTVRGHRAADVGVAHTAHHLLFAVLMGDGERFRIEIARLPRR